MRSRSNSSSSKRDPGGAQANNPERDHRSRAHSLYIVGIGPGDTGHLTRRAEDVLQKVEAVAGYTTYIELIRPLIRDKQIVYRNLKSKGSDAMYDEQTAFAMAIINDTDPVVSGVDGLEALRIAEEINKQLKANSI